MYILYIYVKSPRSYNNDAQISLKWFVNRFYKVCKLIYNMCIKSYKYMIYLIKKCIKK